MDMGVTIRPLTADDIDRVCDIQTRSFNDVDRRFGEPVSQPTAAGRARQKRRVRHFLDHDPGGAFLACLDGRPVGAALALRRGDLWGLSLLVIEPDAQGQGIGRQLLAATMRYAEGTRIGMIESSRDQRALAAYADAGFDLHPQIAGAGVIDRSLLRAPSNRVQASVDPGWADKIDRSLRGAPRGPDHERLSEAGPSYHVDDRDGRGYAYVRDGFVSALAATDEDTATALLWTCLADADGEVRVGHVTAVHQWAIRVMVATRLRLVADGAAFWRGRKPPATYLPSGAYL